MEFDSCVGDGGGAFDYLGDGPLSSERGQSALLQIKERVPPPGDDGCLCTTIVPVMGPILSSLSRWP